MRIEVIQKAMYRTSDGREFEALREAELHDAKLKLAEIIRNDGNFTYINGADDVVTLILDNRVEIANVFDSLV